MSSRSLEPNASRSHSTMRMAICPFGRVTRVLAALLATFAALSSGCAYDDEATGTVIQDLNANSRTAFDYFLGKGLTAVQAAGIIGNLMQESNVDPTAAQPGGPGRGIAQWSVGGRWDHDSGDNAVAFARSNGVS